MLKFSYSLSWVSRALPPREHPSDKLKFEQDTPDSSDQYKATPWEGSFLICESGLPFSSNHLEYAVKLVSFCHVNYFQIRSLLTLYVCIALKESIIRSFFFTVKSHFFSQTYRGPSLWILILSPGVPLFPYLLMWSTHTPCLYPQPAAKWWRGRAIWPAIKTHLQSEVNSLVSLKCHCSPNTFV